MAKLQPAEKNLLASYGKGKWKPVAGVKAAIRRYARYARYTIEKNRRINIRIAEQDLRNIRTRAVEEGIPYQTLIASILHKYLSGRLVEKHQL